tara:strand:- start:59 stop:259 length:201 start_codon:yes stop_codon:yes gene_type:complete
MTDQTMVKRYAIYFVPKGTLAKFGRAWLGWDCRKGQYISSENAFAEPLADREYYTKNRGNMSFTQP